MRGNFTTAETFYLLEALEPIFEKMYDLGQTAVVPVRDLPPLHKLFAA
jgi:hypothetical protein